MRQSHQIKQVKIAGEGSDVSASFGKLGQFEKYTQ